MPRGATWRPLEQESPPADVDQRASQMYAGFLALGHAPAEGVGAGLGAAIAGLDAARWEDLSAAARALSLLQSVPERPRAVRVHPLLAQWLVRQAENRPHASAASVLDRMTDWFVERLPAAQSMQLPEAKTSQGILDRMG